jgi:hypothetical protein
VVSSDDLGPVSPVDFGSNPTSRRDVDYVRGSSQVVTLGLATDDLKLICRTGVSVALNTTDHNEFVRCVATGNVAAAVFDDALLSAAAVRRIAEAAATRGVPLIAHVPLSQRSAEHLLCCARVGASVAVALREFDDLGETVTRVTWSRRASDSVTYLGSQYPEDWGIQVRLLLTEAAIVSRRKTTVSEWARARGGGVRTLQRVLAEQRLPTGKHLLNRMLLVHTAWRMSVLNWPPKSAASAAGAVTVRDLYRPIRRVVPPHRRGAAHFFRFPEASDEFIAWIWAHLSGGRQPDR